MSLDRVRGQDRALKRLRPYLANRQLPPAFLFQGPYGVGKSLAALEFAKALNCPKKTDSCDRGITRGSVTEPNGEEMPPPRSVGERSASDSVGAAEICPSCLAIDKRIDPDIRLIDADYQAGILGEDPEKQRSIKVDTIRHLIKDLELRSIDGRWKAAILEETHRLVPAAANAMLKSLEEPPPNTVWILITHQPSLLLTTIRSRCLPIPFSPLTEDTVAELLTKRGISAEDARQTAPLAEGSMGRALRLLEDPQPDPSSWLSDPMSPFKLSEALPRELYRSRPLAAEHLHRMSWFIRRRHGTAGYAAAPIRTVLRELSGLRRALDANADPRLVIQIGALRLQQLESALAKSSRP